MTLALAACLLWASAPLAQSRADSPARCGEVATLDTHDKARDVLMAATFVYVGNTDSGTLTTLARYPMGQNPNWIEIVDLA